MCCHKCCTRRGSFSSRDSGLLSASTEDAVAPTASTYAKFQEWRKIASYADESISAGKWSTSTASLLPASERCWSITPRR